MQCDCVKRIETDLMTKEFDGRKVQKAKIEGIIYSLELELFTGQTVELTMEGKKRPDKILIRHRFCPFCGKPTQEEKPQPDRDMIKECYSCQHSRSVPGNAHIRCVKPDMQMTGDPHGIEQGWFIYPHLFDPTWKTRLCNNFENNTEEQCQENEQK